MPGSKAQHDRTVVIQVRVTPEEAERWRAHIAATHGYLSVMIRSLVNAHIAVEGPKPKCRHWD